MEFNIEELEEIKLCINTMISERIKYECFENNDNRLSTNEKYKKMDYDLLNRVLNEIKIKKDFN